MANWQGAILTKQGKVLQAKVQAGTKLELTKMKSGNGTTTTTNMEDLVDLVSPKQEFGIASVIPKSDGTCVVRGILTNDSLEVGYNINEVGIFAKDCSSQPKL